MTLPVGGFLWRRKGRGGRMRGCGVGCGLHPAQQPGEKQCESVLLLGIWLTCWPWKRYAFPRHKNHRRNGLPHQMHVCTRLSTFPLVCGGGRLVAAADIRLGHSLYPSSFILLAVWMWIALAVWEPHNAVPGPKKKLCSMPAHCR